MDRFFEIVASVMLKMVIEAAIRWILSFYWKLKRRKRPPVYSVNSKTPRER